MSYSNDDADHARVIAWRDAALADGWTIEATYNSEPVTSCGSIAKDGYKGHVCARVTEEMKKWHPRHVSKWKYESDVNLWGPDGLCIKPPEIYDWAAIVRGTRTCSACGKEDVDTQRYSFAGRCCAACRPEMAKKHEYRGWCD